jgi:hypothetical protein
MKMSDNFTMDSSAELPPGEFENPKTFDIPAPAADFFANLDSLRITPIRAGEPVVKQVLSTVPVRKPSKEWFFKVHPEYSLDTLLLELKEDSETFLVSPALQAALQGENCVGLRTLTLGVNRQGIPFVWALRPPSEGKRDAWATSALDAANLAKRNWVRLQADMGLGAYRIAIADIDDAARFPEEPFEEILRVAFKGHVVDSLDHPALKKLRGEL